MEILGVPSRYLIEQSSRRKIFFGKDEESNTRWSIPIANFLDIKIQVAILALYPTQEARKEDQAQKHWHKFYVVQTHAFWISLNDVCNGIPKDAWHLIKLCVMTGYFTALDIAMVTSIRHLSRYGKSQLSGFLLLYIWAPLTWYPYPCSNTPGTSGSNMHDEEATNYHQQNLAAVEQY